MKGKLYLLAAVLLIVALLSPMVEAGQHKGWLKKPKNKIVMLVKNPFPIWYNYSDYSVRWMANETAVLLVNFDRTNDAKAVSMCGIWHYEYGDCFVLGTTNGLQYKWCCMAGELKIDGFPDYEWHVQAPYMEDCEWYGFSLQKTEPPTDFVAVLHASNGAEFQPILRTFWYSLNNGASWTAFTP